MRFLSITFTLRNWGTVIHIVSARYMTKKEGVYYEKAQQIKHTHF